MANTHKVVDMSNSLYLLDPTAAPLWVLVDRLNRKDCVNTKVEWLMQVGQNTVKEHNFCQIFKKNVAVPKLFIKTNSGYNPSSRSYERRKKGIELMRDFECAMIFGNRQENPNAHPYGGIRTMGGITFFNKKYSNVTKHNTLNINEHTFETLLREIFRYGAAYRTFLCGSLPPFMKKGSKMVTVPKSKTYGIGITQYLSQHGSLNIIQDDILDDFGVFVDLSSLTMRPLKHRGPVMQTNTQQLGDDVVKDTYLAEWTLEVRAPQKGAVIGIPGKSVRSSFKYEPKYGPTLDEILGLDIE